MKIIFDVKSIIDAQGTQREFSIKSGIPANRVSSLYHGVTMVSLKTLAKILEATGLKPNDLFIIEAE